ncbi:MAG TPA: sn-glycerol-3-phosphate ABC transporter ATP-binding protein UgpC [Mycobacterium sp.]
MSAITLEKLTKVFATGVVAVSALDLEVADGEFVVLVGPSGCGKTTALRMVAGLESITSGSVAFDGHVVNDVSPRRRDVAMVFQNYALYPHLTVYQNIGFALENKKVHKDERHRRIVATASTVGLSEMLTRKPRQLSGGQRQRVAMARAIVRQPSVFLMDEPLSNLDAKLRVQMRAEVLRVHQSVGAATLYVTHDQTEAMTMGDRVAVMRDGVLQQYGTPRSLYERPANLFVATFIGSPEMNLYEAGVSSDGSLALGSQRLEMPGAGPDSGLAGYHGRKLIVGIRPEDLGTASASGRGTLTADVRLVEMLGDEQHVYFSIDATPFGSGSGAAGQGEGLLADGLPNGVARVGSRVPIRSGERLPFTVDTARLHFFDPDSGLAIGR